MSGKHKDNALGTLERELREQPGSPSAEYLQKELSSLAIGVPQFIPVVFAEGRMFRVRAVHDKPERTDEVGAPPPKLNTIGRLNDHGQSVLYLADSPDTAFVESQSDSGYFCLSEWRVQAEKLAMANGGLGPDVLKRYFPNVIYEGDKPLPVPTERHERVLALFREIYTLDVGDDTSLYRWSIACGLANGFSHECDRESIETEGGFTKWKGGYPFSAIAYPSTRTETLSLNYAFNDRGRSHLRLNHVQWIERREDGTYRGIDFADGWDGNGYLNWQARPAQFQLKPGESAKLTKVADNVVRFEMRDGVVPWFV